MILPAAQTPASSADETKMSPNGAILLPITWTGMIYIVLNSQNMIYSRIC